MVLAQRLELRQGQSLVMTPQLQQAIKLLQLSNLELATFVEQELERNPLLEREEQGDRDVPGAGSQETLTTPGETGEVLAADLKMGDGQVSADSALDTDLTNDYAGDSRSELQGVEGAQAPAGESWSQVRGSGGSFEDGEYNIEEVLTHEMSLRDHLTEQLQVAISGPVQRMIGAYLIDMVDEAGYLRGEYETAGERLGCAQDDVDAVLVVLQAFEPTGVFARSLRECLALQLKERDRLDPLMAGLLEHLDLVGRRDHAALMRMLSIDSDDLASMIDDIKACNPKPGLIFGSDVVQPVVPDVFVRVGQDGAWQVELNSETLPRVLVNGRYLSEVSPGMTREDKIYLTECLNNANWLVKSLDQRARTILKVASEIVRQQDAFLAHGVEYLRPLNLRTIADAIDMHESTVSRVTANKYVSTPRGLFELKYFFTSAIASVEGGEAHSAEAVRHRIKSLIDAETGEEVLSDDRIVEILRGSGIDIARRTVAKYREALRIPSSVQRRRLKALAS